MLPHDLAHIALENCIKHALPIHELREELGLKLGDQIALEGVAKLIAAYKTQRDEIKTLRRRVSRFEAALNKIKTVMKNPAGNRRFMQIAGPAREVINIVNWALLP